MLWRPFTLDEHGCCCQKHCWLRGFSQHDPRHEGLQPTIPWRWNLLWTASVCRKMTLWCQGSEVELGGLVGDDRKATLTLITANQEQHLWTLNSSDLAAGCVGYSTPFHRDEPSSQARKLPCRVFVGLSIWRATFDAIWLAGRLFPTQQEDRGHALIKSKLQQ